MIARIQQESQSDEPKGKRSQPKLAMRLEEAATSIGVSPRTLDEWRLRGLVPYVKLGSGNKRKLILYPTKELRQWLSNQVIKPTANRQDVDPPADS